MKRKIGLPAVLLLAVAMTGACQSSSTSTSNSGTGAEGAQVVEYQGDYREFGTTKELNGSADTVIEGRITGTSVQEITLLPQGGGSPEENPAAGTGRDPAADAMTMVYTISTVSVTAVHKGTVKAGDVLRIKQLGGKLAGVDYRADRFPLAAKSTYLLFLETYPDGTPASLLNQEQAVFTVAPDGTYVAGPDNNLTVNRQSLTG